MMYVIRETHAEWEKEKFPHFGRDQYAIDDVHYEPVVFNTLSQAQQWMAKEAKTHVGEQEFIRHDTYTLKNRRTEFTWQIVPISESELEAIHCGWKGGLNDYSDDAYCSLAISVSPFGKLRLEDQSSGCKVSLNAYQVDQLKELLEVYT